MPTSIPINVGTIDRVARFVGEDLRAWLIAPDKKPLPQQWREVQELRRAYRAFPYQYWKFDLYRREIGKDYRDYIPTVIADEYVFDINQADLKSWTEDKLGFKRRMQDAQLPIVRTLATFAHRDGTLTVRDRDEQAWTLAGMREAAKELGAARVFVKPRFGLQGIGAFSLNIGAQGCERDSVPIDEAALVAMLQARNYDEFVVEPYFQQHPALHALNPRCLNTLRVITLLTDGKAECTGAFLRVGGGDSETDNWATGGYGAGVNLETGAVGLMGKLKNPRAKGGSVTRHPATNVAFASITIPFLPEIRALVERGAELLAPLRLIGWDVAIGPDGPCLIEANFLPSLAPVQHANGGIRNSAIARELAAKLNWR